MVTEQCNDHLIRFGKLGGSINTSKGGKGHIINLQLLEGMINIIMLISIHMFHHQWTNGTGKSMSTKLLPPNKERGLTPMLETLPPVLLNVCERGASP